jgi:predicted MFS family arabinose efflux permease
MTSPGQLADRVVEYIVEGDGGSVCDELPPEACEEVPRNFLLNVANGSATKLAEQIASPGLVLPWLLAAAGAPTFFAGLLVPVKQAGSLVPQLAVAGRIRGVARRKYVWMGAGITQAGALAVMLPAVALLPPAAAGAAVILLLALFSTASGAGSVAFQDVLAKTVPEGRRGTLLAMRATVGGGLTLAAGLALRVWVNDDSGVGVYLLLVGIAAGLWLLGSLFFLRIVEAPGHTEGARNTLAEAKAGLRLLRDHGAFRRFILVRLCLLSVSLAVPFYALHGRDIVGPEVAGLGVFVIAVGLANMFSSPVWGRFADTSSRRVMMGASAAGAGTGVAALAMGGLPADWQIAPVYALVFLLAGFSEAGERLGRKTYIVDAAPDDDRPLYVALSNTLVGVATLAAGAFGLIAQFFGLEALIFVFAAISIGGFVLAWSLPEASEFTAAD